MRTTIEISDRHRSILLALAARRGLRGYSEIVEEALEQYIARQSREPERKEKVLALEGSWNEDEAEQTKARLQGLREKWNLSK